MKKLGIDSKVIIFSLSVDEKVPRQALALGADAVVSKSVGYAEIKNTIEKIAMQL
jgi:DNA-binding NarL/FixJ family response regulator